MGRLPVATAALVFAATVSALAGAAQPVAVTMAELAKNPDAYVGKRIVLSDCMIMGYSSFVGAQCSPAPLNAALIAYVDVDTMTADAKKLGAECNNADITKKCLVKVTGDVAKDPRGMALIKNATMEMVKYVPAVAL
jgi:hypothetical protein